MQGSFQRMATVPPSMQGAPASEAGAFGGPAHRASAVPATRVRRRRNDAWVIVSSCLIAMFTVFVLLDAFAIERVQQSVREADLSSVLAAQSETGASAETDAGASSGDAGTGSGSGDSSDGALGAAADENDEDDSEAASTTGDSDSQAESGRRHGAHGGPGGKDAGHAGGSSGGSGKTASSNDGTLDEGAGSASTAGTSVGSYSDDNISIQVSQVRAYDTDIYVADIQVSSAEYLKTALAQNAFGRNVKDSTSNMAEAADAILAINGDYYGFRDDGYVVRNGVLYRDEAAAGTDALVVYGDGTMASVSQDEKTAQQLVDDGAWQVLSFGPTLVEDGELVVTADSEVSQAMGSNPRTAIGMIDPLHYIVVVSGGRTGDNAGLTLYQLAQVCIDNGATYAYNLDGGGSSTIWFQGQVLNDPSSGNRDGEREVSDIVYFG